MVADKLKQPKGATDAPHMTVDINQPANAVSHDHIESRGKAIYEEKICHNVDDAHRGKFAVIDVDSGDYEIDADLVAALDRLDGRHPGALPYIMRIGHRAAFKTRVRGTVLAP